MFRIFFALLFTCANWLPAAAVEAAPTIGESAPGLKGTYLDGEQFDLAAMRGKVVLVNYYSSYCKVCALEIGTLETVYEDYKHRGFEIVMLGVDDSVTDVERVERMLKIYHLRGSMVGTLSSNGFGVRYPTPTAFFVDRQGIIQGKTWGAIPLGTLRQRLNQLLDQP